MRRLIAFLSTLLFLCLMALSASASKREALSLETLPETVRIALPENETFVEGVLFDTTCYVLMESHDTTRTIYIFLSNGGRFMLDAKSMPLPNTDTFTASIDSYSPHTFYLYGNAEHHGAYSFTRNLSGGWFLTAIPSADALEISPIFGVIDSQYGLYFPRCLPGKLFDINLSTLNIQTLPTTIAQATAAIDTAGYAMVKSDVPTDRLHLREAPQKGATSIGRYYSGTPVQVLSQEGDWAHVSICGTEGYMMTEFLAFGEDMWDVIRYFPRCTIKDAYADTEVKVYLRPEAIDGLYVGEIGGWELPSSDFIYLLADVGEDFCHIVSTRGLTGYIQTKYLQIEPALPRGITRNVKLDFDSSDLYSLAEMTAAAEVVLDNFQGYIGCELIRIHFHADLSHEDYLLHKKNYPEDERNFMLLQADFIAGPLAIESGFEEGLQENWLYMMVREHEGAPWVIANHGYY